MENLKALRMKKGLSQQRLADLLHISQQSVYKYENGLSEPDVRTLKRLSELFQTSIDYIVGNTENPQKIAFRSETALTERELCALRLYRDLPERQKQLVEALLRELAQADVGSCLSEPVESDEDSCG